MKSLIFGLFLLILAGCAANNSATKNSGKQFTGGKWEIHVISGAAVDPSKSGNALPYVNFDMTEHMMSAFAGCNRMSAGFSLEKDSLSISPMISTRMACPDMDYEYALEKSLTPGKYTFKETDSNLQLFFNGSKVLELKRPTK